MSLFPLSAPVNKFGLNYLLTVDSPAFADDLVPQINITYPYTIQFDVVRTNYAAANTARIRVYNLSKDTQALLQFDQFIGQFIPKDYPNLLTVTLQAGYGNGPNFPVIFTGMVTRSYSVREGVDFITYIEAFDGGAAYTSANVSVGPYNKGTLVSSVVKDIIHKLGPYGVKLGALSSTLDTAITKSVSYSGNAIDLLRDLSSGNFYIDNQKANIIFPNECIYTQKALPLDAQSGLLETPVKQEAWLDLKMLFEPRLAVGSIVDVQASTNESYNGTHQVCSIQHTGIISASVGGACITTVGAVAGIFTSVIQAVT